MQRVGSTLNVVFNIFKEIIVEEPSLLAWLIQLLVIADKGPFLNLSVCHLDFCYLDYPTLILTLKYRKYMLNIESVHYMYTQSVRRWIGPCPLLFLWLAVFE